MKEAPQINSSSNAAIQQDPSQPEATSIIRNFYRAKRRWIILGIIALLVFLGVYYFYIFPRVTVTPITHPTPTITDVSHSNAFSSPTPLAQTTPSYLNIPEMGIRFPAQGLGTISYTTVNRDKTITAQFISMELITTANKLDPSDFCNHPGSAGQLMQSSTEIPNNTATESQGGFVKRVGKFYYYFTYAQNQCSENAQVSQMQQTIEVDVFHALTNIDAF